MTGRIHTAPDGIGQTGLSVFRRLGLFRHQRAIVVMNQDPVFRWPVTRLAGNTRVGFDTIAIAARRVMALHTKIASFHT